MYYATTTIIEFIDPSRMELKADVDEIDVPGVKPGLKAIIELDALPDLLLEGEVTSISLLATEESGLVLYEATIGLDVPEDSGIRAGMTAASDIIIGERESVLLIPSRAIIQGSSGSPVVHVVVDGQVQERAVVTGLSDGYETEVVDGLNEGDMVVVETRS
jgi:multidrug efflux pump subunit AcrA (membrane-fusion protein)